MKQGPHYHILQSEMSKCIIYFSIFAKKLRILAFENIIMTHQREGLCVFKKADPYLLVAVEVVVVSGDTRCSQV